MPYNFKKKFKEYLQYIIRSHYGAKKYTHREKIVFFRNDDVFELTPKLRKLLTIFLKYQVPVDLAVIPAKVNKETASYLLAFKKSHPNLIHFHQHGFRHSNHSAGPKEFEFGSTRNYQEQYQDIKNGQELMKDYFHGFSDDIFTPPHHGSDENTLKALGQLGFFGLSSGSYLKENKYYFKELPVSVDLVSWEKSPVLKYDRIIKSELSRAWRQNKIIGICLHHEFFNDLDFNYIESLIRQLKARPNIRFINMKRIYEN